MKQNNVILIGLTGGIATGKSTVSNIIIEKGYPLIDADKIAREIVQVNRPAYKEIVEVFGEKILNEDKTLDRKSLGNIIFSEKEAREKLNNITHPYIFETIKSEIKRLSREHNIIFLDIPLLFEQFDLIENYNIEFTDIWLVYVEKAIQINRLMKRDGISQDEALRKVESQMPIDVKRTRSSKTIINSGDIELLNKQVDELLLELI
ncbi:dephospho-CoA kinase [Tissierella sp.]|uniref:dephospho-CoA kinase n=1 Tax=Tissierella sp. TaxID=41274 RepID=UPI00285BE035|nr:dephospho-CoA kinase [Tissierella sp.]MDR7857047.1 dephospho-CoA kinase [Tissierella sp.]